MSFKNGAFATLWEHSEGKGNYHEGRISTSKKYKGEYETDFSGYVRFISDAKSKVEKLSNDRHRIKIISCEVTNRYDKEKKKEYTNFAIFDFDVVDNDKNTESKSNSKEQVNSKSSKSESVKTDTSTSSTVNNNEKSDTKNDILSSFSPEQLSALAALMNVVQN